MLIRRKIDPDFADRYKIGFANRTLGYELQTPKCLLGSRNRGQLQLKHQVSLFNATRQTLPESLILCKSALDVLTLLTAGVDNAVATMGVQGFNDIQLSRLHYSGKPASSTSVT